MNWLHHLLGATLAGLGALAQAADLRGMYDDRLLESRVASYREVLMDNLNQVFLPALTPAERRALAGVRLDIPLRGQDGQPFAFVAYTTPGGAVVSMPASSIRLLYDLSLAQAWLSLNGYSISTVYEYVGMLKYQKPPRQTWPDPRVALGIPADAPDNAEVDQLSLQLFNQALSFVLLHELGHIVYRHPGYVDGVARAQARANEAEADRFALEVMRRIGQPPAGVHFFFALASQFGPTRADFDSDASYANALNQATHPVSSDRMLAAAAQMRANAADYVKLERDVAKASRAVVYIADQVDAIASGLANKDLQRLMAMRAQSSSLERLAPRRPR